MDPSSYSGSIIISGSPPGWRNSGSPFQDTSPTRVKPSIIADSSPAKVEFGFKVPEHFETFSDDESAVIDPNKVRVSEKTTAMTWKIFLEEMRTTTSLDNRVLTLRKIKVATYHDYGEMKFHNDHQVVYINTNFVFSNDKVRGYKVCSYDLETGETVVVGELPCLKFQRIESDGKTILVTATDNRTIYKKTEGVDDCFAKVDLGLEELEIDTLKIKIFGEWIVCAVKIVNSTTLLGISQSVLIIHSMDTKENQLFHLGHISIQDFYVDSERNLFISYTNQGFQDEIAKFTDGKKKVLHISQNDFGQFLSISDERIVTFEENRSCGLKRIHIFEGEKPVKEVTKFTELTMATRVKAIEIFGDYRAAVILHDEHEQTWIHIINILTGDTLWKQHLSDCYERLDQSILNVLAGKFVCCNGDDRFVFCFE